MGGIGGNFWHPQINGFFHRPSWHFWPCFLQKEVASQAMHVQRTKLGWGWPMMRESGGWREAISRSHLHAKIVCYSAFVVKFMAQFYCNALFFTRFRMIQLWEDFGKSWQIGKLKAASIKPLAVWQSLLFRTNY